MAEKKVDNPFAKLEESFEDEKAFARVEQFEMGIIRAIAVIPMPEWMMPSRNLDPQDEGFKNLFPDGVACLDIALEGIDVQYAFSDDNLKHITIPMVNFTGQNIGKQKGQGSQLHITSDAFKTVFGVGLFGSKNRASLIDRKARWGQHLGDAVIDGARRDWGWDIPRTALPDDYEFKGEVRVFKGKGADSGSGTGGTATLSEEDAISQVLEVVSGWSVDDPKGALEAVLKINGLTSQYVNLALDATLLKVLFKDKLIDQKDGIIVVLEGAAA